MKIIGSTSHKWDDSRFRVVVAAVASARAAYVGGGQELNMMS